MSTTRDIPRELLELNIYFNGRHWKLRKLKIGSSPDNICLFGRIHAARRLCPQATLSWPWWPFTTEHQMEAAWESRAAPIPYERVLLWEDQERRRPRTLMTLLDMWTVTWPLFRALMCADSTLCSPEGKDDNTTLLNTRWPHRSLSALIQQGYGLRRKLTSYIDYRIYNGAILQRNWYIHY